MTMRDRNGASRGACHVLATSTWHSAAFAARPVGPGVLLLGMSGIADGSWGTSGIADVVGGVSGIAVACPAQAYRRAGCPFHRLDESSLMMRGACPANAREHVRARQ